MSTNSVISEWYGSLESDDVILIEFISESAGLPNEEIFVSGSINLFPFTSEGHNILQKIGPDD